MPSGKSSMPGKSRPMAISDWTSALRLITDPVDDMALLPQQAHGDGRDVQP